MSRHQAGFETVLEAWLDDGPSSAPADLVAAAFDAIPSAHRQRRRTTGPWRPGMSSSITRAIAALAAVAIIAVGGFAVLRGLAPVGETGGSPTPRPSDVAVLPSPPSATPAPTIGPATLNCTHAQLAARVVGWEGAMGHRIATVVLSNAGSGPCQIATLALPQLVVADGTVLISGEAPASWDALTLDPGAAASTLVDVSNYCGPEVVGGAVSVAFVLANDAGRVAAAPVSATDRAGLPPCTGNPGSAGSIQMHPWQPGTNPE